MGFLSSILFYAVLPLMVSHPDFRTTYSNDRDGIIILEGKYQERNIYVANSLGSEGVGYCTYEIRVNGDLVTDEINSDAFEIDLTSFDFAIGDAVIIEIKHKVGCTPKVINPGGLRPKATFVTKEINVNKDGFLEWVTTDEFGELPFIIQQYKWNKWLDIGEVQGKGTPAINNYAFHVDFISGVNKYRVVQKDGEGRIKKSQSVEITSSVPQLQYIYNRKTEELVFTGPTQYEIYDKYGEIMMRGYGATINLSKLAKDEYWLSFDNLTEKFKKS